ncbi:MAG: replication initiator [Pseudonocardiaceae bacterium]
MTIATETMAESPTAHTRAERLRQPLAADVLVAVADQHGVCVRPFTMEVGDPATGELRYVPLPCGSTLESVCGPCARKARALRIVQCREGWHLTEEPTLDPQPPTAEQRTQLTTRADLVTQYRGAVQAGRDGDAEELREAIREADEKLRQLGVRGRLPAPELPGQGSRKRSTRRRQDAPSLPTRRISKTTVGREYAGRFRPSMFLTLTCDSYGRVHQDGTPIDPPSYDYRRAARDAVHFASLVDRWWQNLRRVVGWDVQYFATVEPQRRAAPHLHAALRGSIPHEVIRQVTAATYHQVWWPHHDHLLYTEGRLPVWEPTVKGFVDPDTRQPLTTWAQALEQVQEPAHVVSFGPQVHSKGILGGTDDAGRHLGYLTKYLVKSVSEIVTPHTDAQRRHADRLHAELSVTPCSPCCAVWLLYGIQPQSTTSKTMPGHCKGRAHRRSTLGLPGWRVLVSRKWSGKTLADHRADRMTFVTQALAAVGIEKPTHNTLIWRKLAPGDPNVPPRAHLLMHAIAERIAWRAEYDRAMLAANGPPPSVDVSAVPQAA